MTLKHIQTVKTQKYKNTRNNYSNIFTVMGALKSLLCFPLDIDVNDILNYRTNYLYVNVVKKQLLGQFEHASFDCDIA